MLKLITRTKSAEAMMYTGTPENLAQLIDFTGIPNLEATRVLHQLMLPNDEFVEPGEYVVKHSTGGISSCTAQELELNYKPRFGQLEGVDFGRAIVALKNGMRVCRKGWNGKGMWLRYVSPYHDAHFKVTETPEAQGTLLPWIGMKTADNGFVPWLASQTDVLAEDWVILPDTDTASGGN